MMYDFRGGSKMTQKSDIRGNWGSKMTPKRWKSFMYVSLFIMKSPFSNFWCKISIYGLFATHSFTNFNGEAISLESFQDIDPAKKPNILAFTWSLC